MRKIVFHFHNSVHLPVLLPLYHQVKTDPSWQVGFSFPSAKTDYHIGLTAKEEATLRSMPVSNHRAPSEASPDITIVADIIPEIVHGCGFVVNVGHGLLSKGIYFTGNKVVQRENVVDLICVPGEFHRQRLLNSGKIFTDVAVTGYPKLDRLLSGNYPSREALMQQAGLDPSRKLILYAPTFNMELSAIPILWTRIRHLVKPDRYLMIKLHGATPEEFKAVHKHLAETYEAIRYVDDADITPYLHIADVMISDVSSAFMEFIALDKPVVLFNNPNQKEYSGYDPRDPEYAWRDVGFQVNNFQQLTEAVDRSLVDPGEFSERRREIAAQILSRPPGGACQAVFQAIDNCYRERSIPAGKDRPGVLVLVMLNATRTLEDLTATLASLEQEPLLDIDFLILDDEIIRPAVRSKLPADRLLPRNEISRFFEQSNGRFDFLLFLEAGVKGEDKWVFRLVNHLRRQRGLDCTAPLAINGAPVQDAVQRLGIDPKNAGKWFVIDRYVRLGNAAENFRPLAPPSLSCFMVRSDSPLLNRWLNLQPGSEWRLENSDLGKTAIAMDVVVAIPDSGIHRIIEKPLR